MPNIRLKLSPTKQVIAQNASRIYSAYVAAGVTEGERRKVLKRAIEEAILIARAVDESLQSDTELPAPQIGPSEEGEEIPLAADMETEEDERVSDDTADDPSANPSGASQAAEDALSKEK